MYKDDEIKKHYVRSITKRITLILAPGGRVTDYRFTDLGELMRANRLAPWFGTRKTAILQPDDPLEKAHQRLSRYTLKCPLTISSTTIFNMVHILI